MQRDDAIHKDSLIACCMILMLAEVAAGLIASRSC